jgi:hypothetical protein
VVVSRLGDHLPAQGDSLDRGGGPKEDGGVDVAEPFHLEAGVAGSPAMVQHARDRVLAGAARQPLDVRHRGPRIHEAEVVSLGLEPADQLAGFAGDALRASRSGGQVDQQSPRVRVGLEPPIAGPDGRRARLVEQRSSSWEIASFRESNREIDTQVA